MSALGSAVEGSVLPEIESGAHRLAGSSGTIGAMNMHRQCKALEERARDGQLDGAAQRLKDIDREFSAVRVALEQEFGRELTES